MKFEAKLVLPKSDMDTINGYLTAEKADEFQGEDNVISHTVKFPNGLEMDIKCCGCREDPSWAEAVLFEIGLAGITIECNVSDIEEEYAGPWELEDGSGNIYHVDIVAGDDLVSEPALIPLSPESHSGWRLN